MATRHDVVTHPFTIDLIRIKARQLCRRSDVSRSDQDDMQQEMRLYLWKKAHLFDPGRGNIEAFVTTAINSWVAMHLRGLDRIKRRGDATAISLERTLIENEGDVTSLGSVITDADRGRRNNAGSPDPVESHDLRDAIDHALAQLTGQERSLLEYVAEHGISAAARTRKVSRRQIYNALEGMRSRFEDAGLGSA
ncbi:MAG: sigma factor [Planctomycetota bacterium]